MGLERVAAVMQNVSNVYETDGFKPIVETIEKKAEVRNQKVEDVRHVRIIADHIKAAVFMLADGVEPSNVDQGYVLRKIIRRAIRSAKKLNLQGSAVCSDIARMVVEQYKEPYPKLTNKAPVILTGLDREEQQFRKTLEEGLKHFSKFIEKHKEGLDGQTVFHLYDTYGFPFELTKELAAEQNIPIDEEGYQKAFEEHQQKSRAGAEKRFAGGLADHSAETTKLHTATHLLQAALKKVLGDHVYQKGSNVTAERLRFDFPHPEKMTPEQIKHVEDLVNKAIQDDLPVSFHVTTVEGAKKEGAIGVFDDRYETDVKVYVMGDEKKGVFSKEICGGPHVARTSMLGSFKIQKEESSSAGIRRIKATVSGGPAEIETAKQI
jgi:alanyl-tRNA synthetase